MLWAVGENYEIVVSQGQMLADLTLGKDAGRDKGEVSDVSGWDSSDLAKDLPKNA